MLQRHQLKVDSLHERPQHPILLQRRPIRTIQLILRTRPLHDGHTAQKTEQICRSENRLISQNAGGDGSVFAAEIDSLLEEFEPRCCGRTKDG